MNTYMKILALALTIVSMTFLNACKRPPETGNVGVTTAPENQVTEPLGPCSGGHKYVDGFCTECGKEFSSEGLEYTLSEDGTYYIVSSMGSCTDTEITVPSVYNKKPVKEIGPYSFDRNDRIRKVNLPEGILSIGENAFDNCKSLVSVNLPDSLKSIGKDAFRGCSVLSGELKIPDKITVIENGTFSECQNITSVVLPKDLTSIGDEAFKGLYKLREISIPENLTHVGKDAFVGFRLDSVNITNFNAWCNIEFENVHSNPMVNSESPALKGAELVINGEAATAYVMGDEVKKINNYTFAGCSSLTNVTFAKKLEYIGDGAFYGCTGLQEAILPDSLTYLGESAFSDCTKLSDIKIPQSITEIKSNAFSNCDSIRSINIHKDISSIREAAFSGCDRISEILFDGNISEWEAIVKEADWSKNVINCTLKCSDATEIINRISLGLEYSSSTYGVPNALIVTGLGTCTDTEIYIPAMHDGKPVVQIESECFKNQKQITKIVIPDSVTDIYPNAFYGCENLKEVVLCSGLDYIDELFNGCTALESIVLPEGVRMISLKSFMDCTSLKSVTLPSTVKEIHDYAFLNCTSLTDIYYNGTKEQFNNIYKSTLWAPNTTQYIIHCTDGDLTAIDASCASDLEFTLAPGKTFYLVSGRGKCTGPIISVPAEYNGKPVSSIQAEAFKNDKALTNVILPEGIITIGTEAFSGSGVKDITIPSTLSTVKNNAFSGTDVDTVRITSVDNWCKITFATKESNPLSSSADILLNGEPLINLEIGNDISLIRNYQFTCCTSIRSLRIAEGVQSIGDHAFSGCTSLSEISFPDTLTSIGTHAFSYCTSLPELIFPLGVKEINTSFQNCYGVGKIYFPKNVKSVKNASFQNCSSLTETIYDGTVEEWTNTLNSAYGLFITSYNVYCTDGIVNHGTIYLAYPFDRKLSTDGKYYIINGKGSCTDSGIVIEGTYNNLPVTEIADGAFEGEAHSIIYICDGIASIGKNAFKNCKDTVYVRLPNTLKAIGDGAFDGIESTARIVFDGTIAEWNAISGSFKGVVCTDGVIS